MALTLFEDMIFERDRIKCYELAKYLHTVEISKSDLGEIYKQANHPTVLENNSEI
jgi:hypothetical protein